MFEARLPQSSTLKKLLEAVKELIEQANFDCGADGISLQVRFRGHVCVRAVYCQHVLTAPSMYRLWISRMCRS